MGKIKVIKLDEKQKAELEKGYRESDSHALRQRCHLILLKSRGQTSQQAANVLGCCEMAVNNWVKRFLKEGIEYEWLSAADCLDWENLKYQVRLGLSNVGSLLKIYFSNFNHSLI